MMKIIAIILILFSCYGCKKSSNSCTNVTVTLTAPSCKGIGVIIDGTKYPADDLPAKYAVEGQNICIEYSFWNDPALCVCCGGKKVHVIAVHPV